MAVVSELAGRKLQVRVQGDGGTQKFKDLTYNNLVNSVANDKIYAAGTGIASLQKKPLVRIAVVETNVLAENA